MRFKITPSNREFFQDFTAVAQNLIDAVDRLGELLADTQNAASRYAAIKGIERRGDDLTEQILQRLHSSFVTPFDREDIHNLAETIDDVVDKIHHVSQMIALTGIVEVIPELHEQIAVLALMVGEVKELFSRLENMRGLREIVERLGQLEREGDDIYRRTLARLFSGELEVLEVLKWKDIIESMEDALDRTEDVARIVSSLVVKYA
ncbi:MAG: DUF47 family protein [Acidimicrobiia bacterium]|nr:DUF47 family protein [Acidimicrobiia bacterium]